MLFFIRLITNRSPFVLKIVLWKTGLILQYILKYRSKVILSNLESSVGFQYSKEQIKNIHKKYYSVLIRYIREVFYIISYDKIRLKSLIKIDNAEKWSNYFQLQKSTIITASHYGNWEMNMVLLPCFVSQRVIAFYKPISDSTIDNIMLKIRSAFGLELYPIEQTMRVMNHLKDENILYVFIGDQTPLNMNGVYWNMFLHQATPWLTGAEKLAKKYNLPVLYLQQIPETESNISYTLRFHIITENPDHEASGSITEKYSRILENEIIAKPEYWLWSHKRWKRAHHKTID